MPDFLFWSLLPPNLAGSILGSLNDTRARGSTRFGLLLVYWQATWQPYWWLNSHWSSFLHGALCSSVPFSPSLHTAVAKTYFFLPGLVETSQSDQKRLLETEKDSLTINQTKSPLFLKSSEYVKLYEKFTFICFRACCTWQHLDLNVFCYNVCRCCLPDYIFKQQ